MVRTLGKCFHPNTIIKLKSGEKTKICDLELGAELIDGSIIESVMKINNRDKSICYYEIIGENNEQIYVTGSHYVFDKKNNHFIQVENYEKAKKTDITDDWFSCVITNTHNIPISGEIFWDWEDWRLH
jgi:hypothetical protein